ncbi:hypothetical protein [Nonomuraea polychroma]|uniref:hypothetical protein n=1 Tax=Nonomuraea polychroma TaxID=46176 RepID=UPI0019D47676|nr:hypothetical protein [Nonomuraea polychroma]
MRTVVPDRASGRLPVPITEFDSSYRPDNPVHDTAFNAAYLAPVPAAGGEVADHLVTRGDDGRASVLARCEPGRPRSARPRELDVLREAAEPARSHRSLPVAGGRVDADLMLGRHEVTLVEPTPVVDETPPWWDDGRLLGQEVQ